MAKIVEQKVVHGLDKIANEVKELRHSVAKILELIGPSKNKTTKVDSGLRL